MPSCNLPQRLLLTERFFHNLVALLSGPPTRLGHLFLLAVPSLSMAILLSLIPCSESGGTLQNHSRPYRNNPNSIFGYNGDLSRLALLILTLHPRHTFSLPLLYHKSLLRISG